MTTQINCHNIHININNNHQFSWTKKVCAEFKFYRAPIHGERPPLWPTVCKGKHIGEPRENSRRNSLQRISSFVDRPSLLLTSRLARGTRLAESASTNTVWRGFWEKAVENGPILRSLLRSRWTTHKQNHSPPLGGPSGSRGVSRNACPPSRTSSWTPWMLRCWRRVCSYARNVARLKRAHIRPSVTWICVEQFGEDSSNCPPWPHTR